MDQVKAVVPLALYLALFQILFLQHMVEDSWIISGGLFAVIAGLMLFMEGFQLGLMPFGTVIGSRLPRKSPFRWCWPWGWVSATLRMPWKVSEFFAWPPSVSLSP